MASSVGAYRLAQRGDHRDRYRLAGLEEVIP